MVDKERLIRDIYHRGVIFCKPGTPLQEVIKTMVDTEIHAVMVAEQDGKPPVGVVSHTDALAYYGEDLTAVRARDVMTPDVISIPEDATVEAAVKTLLESGFNRLLVVGDDGKPLGILSTTDIIREMRETRWVWYLA